VNQEQKAGVGLTQTKTDQDGKTLPGGSAVKPWKGRTTLFGGDQNERGELKQAEKGGLGVSVSSENGGKRKKTKGMGGRPCEGAGRPGIVIKERPAVRPWWGGFLQVLGVAGSKALKRELKIRVL